MSALAVFTILKSFLKRYRSKGGMTAEEASEQYMQNPGTSTVEIIRHLNVGKFDKKAAPAASTTVTSFLSSSLAAVVNKVSSNDYYEEINRVNTLDILDSLQNPMRSNKNASANTTGSAAVTARAATIAAGLQPQATRFASPSSVPHGSSDATTELDTVDLIRRMGGGNNKIGGVAKTNTMDLLDEMNPSRSSNNRNNSNKVSPYLQQQEKENSYYNNNLSTIEFIRNGDSALAAKNAAAGGVPKKASAQSNNANSNNANNTSWYANISLQNPFDKK